MVPAGVAAAVAKAQAAAAAISASTALVPAAPDFLPAAAFSGAKPNMVVSGARMLSQALLFLRACVCMQRGGGVERRPACCV